MGIGGRPGRSGEAGGRGPAGGTLQEEQESSQWRLPHPLGPRTPAELPGQSPALQSPHPGHVGLGGIGRRSRGEQERQVGGALPDPRLEEQERRGGCLGCSIKPRKPAGLPDEVPCPLRPGVGVMPGPLLFLESKPHPTPKAPRAFSSPVGPEHWPHPLPKPHPCLGPALHS